MVLKGTVHNKPLPTGTCFGEFEITGLVGKGDFGIVYLAQDHSLERKVAIKEYMPSLIAARMADAITVKVRSVQERETFETGRRSFMSEARMLAQFDHPALVKVSRFWEANGTAYMVMPYYEGHTLRDALKVRARPVTEAWVRKILKPVADALALMHRDNCLHRDISPDSIMLLEGNDRPVLLDFDAARRVIGDMTQALTSILRPGFAPVEQYSDLYGIEHGPWTDIYALGAVIHFMILGKTPPISTDRLRKDTYRPLASVAAGRFSDTFLRGVDHCLAVKVEDRPQTMAQMREVLGWNQRNGNAQQSVLPASARSSAVTKAGQPDGTSKLLRSVDAVLTRTYKLLTFGTLTRANKLLTVGLMLVLVLGGGYLLLRSDTPDPLPKPVMIFEPSLRETIPSRQLPPPGQPAPVASEPASPRAPAPAPASALSRRATPPGKPVPTLRREAAPAKVQPKVRNYYEIIAAEERAKPAPAVAPRPEPVSAPEPVQPPEPAPAPTLDAAPTPEPAPAPASAPEPTPAPAPAENDIIQPPRDSGDST
jgi:serine/threonine protein kinase